MSTLFASVPNIGGRQNQLIRIHTCKSSPGCVAQPETCLAADICLTADPGFLSSIPPWWRPEKISTLILLPSADSRREVSNK